MRCGERLRRRNVSKRGDFSFTQLGRTREPNRAYNKDNSWQFCAPDGVGLLPPIGLTTESRLITRSGPYTRMMLELSAPSGGAVFGCGSFRKCVFPRRSINRCPITSFIVFFIIIHKLEREKALERVLERFCNLS